MAIYCAKPPLLCLVVIVLVCYDPLAAEEKPRDSESEADSLHDVEESPEGLQEYEEDLVKAHDIVGEKRRQRKQVPRIRQRSIGLNEGYIPHRPMGLTVGSRRRGKRRRRRRGGRRRGTWRR